MSDNPYLLMFINICHGDWDNKLKSIDMRVDEEN